MFVGYGFLNKSPYVVMIVGCSLSHIDGLNKQFILSRLYNSSKDKVYICK